MRRLALALLGGSMLGCAPHAIAPQPEPEPEVQVVAAPPTEPDPDATRWTPLRIGEGCIVRIAENPETLKTRLRWEPCADGTPGCHEMSQPAALGASMELRTIEGVATADGFVVAMSISLGGIARRYGIGPLDGPPFVAIEGPVRESCSLGEIGLSDDGAVIEIGHRSAHDDTTRSYLRGPLHDDPAWRTLAAVLSRSDTRELVGAQVRSISGRVVVGARGEALAWAGDLGWHLVPGSRSDEEGGVQSSGTDVLFTIDEVPHRVMGARLGFPPQALRTARDWRHGIDGLAVAGGRASWLEGRGRTRRLAFQTVELWTAEVSAGPKLSGERRLATLPRTRLTRTHVGADIIAVPLRDDGSALAVVSLADARVRVLRPPTGREIQRVVWLGHDEIAVAVGPDEPWSDPTSIRRVDVSALPLLDSVARAAR